MEITFARILLYFLAIVLYTWKGEAWVRAKAGKHRAWVTGLVYASLWLCVFTGSPFDYPWMVAIFYIQYGLERRMIMNEELDEWKVKFARLQDENEKLQNVLLRARLESVTNPPSSSTS